MDLQPHRTELKAVECGSVATCIYCRTEFSILVPDPEEKNVKLTTTKNAQKLLLILILIKLETNSFIIERSSNLFVGYVGGQFQPFQHSVIFYKVTPQFCKTGSGFAKNEGGSTAQVELLEKIIQNLLPDCSLEAGGRESWRFHSNRLSH